MKSLDFDRIGFYVVGMIISAIVAALHYLTLALGFGAVFLRGRALKALRQNPGLPVSGVFRSDSMWGVAALLWLLTGLARAFGGLEKGSAYYLHNHFFYLKMTLFVLVVLLELKPGFTFMSWRKQLKAGASVKPADGLLKQLYIINHAEMALIGIIVFVASFMARGFGVVP